MHRGITRTPENSKMKFSENSEHLAGVKPDIDGERVGGGGGGGVILPFPSWFSFNDSKKVKAVTLEFRSIQ